MEERSRYRQFEDQFHRLLRQRAELLVRGGFPADRVVFEEMPDGADGVRAILGRLRVYDRDALNTLPGTRAMQLRFHKRILGPVRRTLAVARAQMLAPVEALVRGQTPGPVGREDVLDALARYQQLPRALRPSGAIFASATGFTADARALVNSSGVPSLVLLGGRADGGWDIDMPPAVAKTPWAKLFELESQDERLKRVMYHLERNANLLDSRGIPVAALAEQVGLPREQTAALVRKATRQDARLVTFEDEGALHVCRSPLAEEKSTMGMWSKVRRWMGFKPTVAERVREMTMQRTQIERQRYEIDQKIDVVEKDERELIQRGAAAPSEAEKRQVAAKLMRARRDLKRLRSEEAVFSKQIDILGTHIHHATLTERGKRVAMPSAEELTREAAQAEQVIGELSANADLVNRIEINTQSPLMAAEEADILKEFEQVAAGKSASGAPAAADTGKVKAGSAAAAGPARAPELPPVPGEKSKARPELG